MSDGYFKNKDIPIEVGDKFYVLLRGYIIVIGILLDGSIVISNWNSIIFYFKDKNDFINNHYNEYLEAMMISYNGNDKGYANQQLNRLKKHNKELYRKIIIEKIIS